MSPPRCPDCRELIRPYDDVAYPQGPERPWHMDCAVLDALTHP